MADPAVPLTVLTGFLGAGKTTLVNRILAGLGRERVGVLVNDFGAINIDRALVESESEGVLNLANGCICCSLRGDLVTAVLSLLDRPDAPHRIVLEASGVADPWPIAATFMAPAFRHRLRLDGIVCVVDAERAFQDPATLGLQLRQVAYSDLVIVNKADLAGPAGVARTAARIRAEFAGARLLEASHCEVPADVLFSSAPDGPSPARIRPAEGPTPSHADQFETWSYRGADAFDADALHELSRRLPAGVYRAKGVLRVAGRHGGPDRRGVLQVVGRRADLHLDRPWDAAQDEAGLVVIGAARSLRPAELQALVESCLSNVKCAGRVPGIIAGKGTRGGSPGTNQSHRGPATDQTGIDPCGD